MSRVANNPITVPNNVEVSLSAAEVVVKGPLGTLRQKLDSAVLVERNEGKLKFKAADDTIQASAFSGTMRALVANMIEGVTKGFEKKLTLVGIGYRAQAQGNVLNLNIGFSHPRAHKMPEGIKVETPTQTEIVIKGIDKQKVGQVAAEVRALRSPEPYKGKGLRYGNEVVVLKETKKK